MRAVVVLAIAAEVEGGALAEFKQELADRDVAAEIRQDALQTDRDGVQMLGADLLLLVPDEGGVDAEVLRDLLAVALDEGELGIRSDSL